MNMLYENLIDQKQLLIENEIKLEIIGDITRLPGKLKKKLMETIELSKNYDKMQLNLALNYGSRPEILNAVKRIVEDNISPSKINEKLSSTGTW